MTTHTISRFIWGFFVFWVCLLFFGCQAKQGTSTNKDSIAGKVEKPKKENYLDSLRKQQNAQDAEDYKKIKPGTVPLYALETLKYILENGKAPEGYVGGRPFKNREKRLPQSTPDGKKIEYQEWDAKKKKFGKNRGMERLVTGNNNTAYYTKDHYRTFVEINTKTFEPINK